MTHRLGLIVNPIAGMGGSVGLKGTDGNLVDKAQAMGASPLAGVRAVTALTELVEFRNELLVLTCSGEMGATAAEIAGLRSRIVLNVASAETTAEDTRAAANTILKYHPELIVLVGGDGTARDVSEVVGRAIPILGVPSGVKMHSAIFATTARAAGEVARRYFLTNDRDSLLRDGEIMDRETLNTGGVSLSPKLFGMVRTLQMRFLVPGAKSSSPVTERETLGGAIYRAGQIIDDERVSLLGPGSTMLDLKRRLGIVGTPLGVDAIADGRCLAEDVNEEGILRLINNRSARIVVSIVGGQGFLFGRGNQQLSARVIRAVGTDNIVIVSSLEKLMGLGGNCLLVDTGDEALDDCLAGYVPVIVSSTRTVMMPVRNASREALK
ncbi:MAG: NAD(+)/NADH kinase [Proteobacteria bacterium]|nr:NAD(+)/NADH kinase [Pseudomonadota bacterium]